MFDFSTILAPQLHEIRDYFLQPERVSGFLFYCIFGQSLEPRIEYFDLVRLLL